MLDIGEVRERGRRARGPRSGISTVELAMVLPLLLVLLFGIIEFGLIVKDVMGINQAAREGARAAVVGATPSIIDVRINGAAATLDVNQLTKLYEYRHLYEDTATWGEWTVLGTCDGDNNAVDGDQIRVSIDYTHQLVSGGLFSGLADNPEEGTMTLSSAIIMRRE